VAHHRDQADEFAVRSQRRAGEAQASGRFDREIAPVVVGANGDGRVISQDQGIRPDTTVESLASLQPAFRPDGILTRATAFADHRRRCCGAPDGRWNGPTRLGSRHVLGLPRNRCRVDPVTMLTGPIPATARLLERAGLKIDDIRTSSRSTRHSRRWSSQWEHEHHPTWSG